MPTRRSLVVALAVLTSVTALSCAERRYQPTPGAPRDGLYDTAFPQRDAARHLEDLIASVRMINCVVYYRHATFPAGSRIRRADITDDLIRERAVAVDFFTDTASGTATVVQHERGRLALLTSAHVVNFPDTLLFYAEAGPDGGEGFVQSIALKERQQNYVPDLEGADDLEILALDETLDVVLLGQRLEDAPTRRVPVFSYPLGNARDLEWGSFVYIVGFPAGAKMISRGIVSKPFRDEREAFLIDAPFNRGFSGGLVLAVRDGVPNFEWVGMATSSSAYTEQALVPERDLDAAYDPRLPYQGDVFVEERRALRYGITICLSIDAVRAFVRDHAASLARRGYRLRMFE